MLAVLLRWLLVAVHRIRARGPSVLVTLALIVVSLGIPAFQMEASARNAQMSWHESLYWTLGLFTLTNNPFNYAQTTLLRALYFTAPVIAASALLGALIHLLEQRAPLFVRSFRSHTVLAGLGNLGTSLASDLTRRGKLFVGIDRDENAPTVTMLRSSGDALVLIGDLANIEVLKRARCERAARVFFTSQSDVLNLDAAFTVRKLARDSGIKRPPRVYAHVYDVALSDGLDHQLRPRDPSEVPIITFNAYRIAAKSLLAHLVRERVVSAQRVSPGLALVRTGWPDDDDQLRESTSMLSSLEEDRRRLLRAFRLEQEPRVDPPMRYVIVGVGRFGRAVLRELLDATPGTTEFLVVERTEEMVSRCVSTLNEDARLRTEMVIGDASTANNLDRIAFFAPQAVVICTDNDIANLRLALELRRRNIRVITRMFGLESSTELVRGLDERGIAPMGLARLFRAAIPILTHTRQLRACVNLDVARTPDVDHLFYLARVTPDERKRLGSACVGLDELPSAPGVSAPADLALVWHLGVPKLDVETPTESDFEYRPSVLLDPSQVFAGRISQLPGTKLK